MTLKQAIDEAMDLGTFSKQIDQAVLDNQEFQKKISQNPDIAKTYQQDMQKTTNIVNGLKTSFQELQKNMLAQQQQKAQQPQQPAQITPTANSPAPNGPVTTSTSTEENK